MDRLIYVASCFKPWLVTLRLKLIDMCAKMETTLRGVERTLCIRVRLTAEKSVSVNAFTGLALVSLKASGWHRKEKGWYILCSLFALLRYFEDFGRRYVV